MVLSDRSIREELARGRVVITPLHEGCIQPASVDIHLGRMLRVFRPWMHPYYIDLRHSLNGLTEEFQIPEDGHFALQPGQFVLGSTEEHIEVPDDLMARLEGKSSLGRVGLLVHATAGYVDPGWRGCLTLELSNVAPLPILLYPGMKISQISFYRLTTPAERPYGSQGLGSKYQGQVGPTPTRFHMEFPQPTLLSLPSIPIQEKSKPSNDHESPLLRWLRQSDFQGSPTRLAKELGVPVKTVQDWLYRGSRPSEKYMQRLYRLTRLPEFRTQDASPSDSQGGLLPRG